VQQSDSTLERLLHLRGARRDRERNSAELGIGIVMLVRIIGQHGKRQQQQRAEQ
jgi:hypothetical protein